MAAFGVSVEEDPPVSSTSSGSGTVGVGPSQDTQSISGQPPAEPPGDGQISEMRQLLAHGSLAGQ